MANEQKNDDLIAKEVMEQLTKWHDEDPDNRAVIVIALENDGDKQHVENFINGTGTNLIDALHHTVSDYSKENQCARLMRRAMMMHHLESACESLEHLTNALEARLKSEKGEETKETKEEEDVK